MLVKLIVSAVGADFSLTFGQELEFSDLKAAIGNGAENFCVPVDPDTAWPPLVLDEIEQAVTPPAEIPEIAPEVETAVFAPVVETATKHRKPRR